jgi:hypothetical protein
MLSRRGQPKRCCILAAGSTNGQHCIRDRSRLDSSTHAMHAHDGSALENGSDHGRDAPSLAGIVTRSLILLFNEA